MAQVMRWVRMWVTAYVPSGSSLNVYISPSESGSDWTLVKTLSTNTAPTSTPIYLEAVAQAMNARYLRVRFLTAGPVEIYEWTREETYEPLK